MGAVATFILTLSVAGVTALVGGQAWTNFQDFLHLVLPIETAWLTGVIGYYLGSSKR